MGNKCDLGPKRAVSFEQGKELGIIFLIKPNSLVYNFSRLLQKTPLILMNYSLLPLEFFLKKLLRILIKERKV